MTRIQRPPDRPAGIIADQKNTAGVNLQLVPLLDKIYHAYGILFRWWFLSPGLTSGSTDITCLTALNTPAGMPVIHCQRRTMDRRHPCRQKRSGIRRPDRFPKPVRSEILPYQPTSALTVQRWLYLRCDESFQIRINLISGNKKMLPHLVAESYRESMTQRMLRQTWWGVFNR